MAAFTKFNQFVEDVFHGKHDFSSDTYELLLSATAPDAADAVAADITEISYTNLSSRDLTLSSSGQTAGTYKPVFSDLTLSASGGAVATFRYVSVANKTQTSPLKPLVCFFDIGEDVTLSDGDSRLVDLDGTNGLFTSV